MRNPGFFKLSVLAPEPLPQTPPKPRGIPVVDPLVTPVSVGNTALDLGGRAMEWTGQHPGFFGDMAHIATDSALVNNMINSGWGQKARTRVASVANSRPVQNVVNNPIAQRITSWASPKLKQLAKVAPRAAPGISVLSGANRLHKNDQFGAALDGISTVGSGLALARVKPKYTIPLAIAADATNIYRDLGSPGLKTVQRLVPDAGEDTPIPSTSAPSGGAVTSGTKSILFPQPSTQAFVEKSINYGAKPPYANRKMRDVRPKYLPPKVGSYDESSHIKEAFVRGMWKRAEQLGLEKEAFIAPLLAGAIDIAGSIGGAHLLTKGLGRLAAMKNMGVVGKGAKKFYNWTQSPGTTMGPLVGNMAMMTASDMATRPVLSPVKRMLGLEQPEAPRYQ